MTLKISSTLLALLSLLAAPAASASSCIGDTTGPFTPYVCYDASEGDAHANVGPVSTDVRDGSSLEATLGHPLGHTTLRVP